METLLTLARDPSAWAALATLVAMEIVLGIDNLIFISILSNKLPEQDRSKARRLGIGGALIMVPFMTVGAGIERHLTQGITLAVICITTLTGGYTHYKLGNVDMKATVAIAPMAAIVGLVTSRFIATQISTPWLTGVFGLAMLYFAYQFTFVTAKPKPAPAATDATSTTR